MRQTTPADATDATAAPHNPIDDFSHCHEGIVAQLDRLAGLPAQAAVAAQARQTAAALLQFFNDVVFEHHQEEEKELFPAVLASAMAGDERDTAQAIVQQLVAEHRAIESAWQKLVPALKAVAKGRDAALDSTALDALVARYRAHATFEEKHFLPLSQQILGRNSHHLAALGLSLHIRHRMPAVMQRYGSRV